MRCISGRRGDFICKLERIAQVKHVGYTVRRGTEDLIMSGLKQNATCGMCDDHLRMELRDQFSSGCQNVLPIAS